MRYYGGGYGGYYGGYGGYQYGYGGHRRGMLLDEFDCLGGCPMNAFCDYGVCRCRSGYDARYGSCWNRIEDFNRHEAQWNTRQNANYNPNGKCVSHGDCRSVDMNMICQDETCQCRQDMQWNEEALECQIYIVRFKTIDANLVSFI